MSFMAFLTIEQAARVLQLKPRGIEGLIAHGKLTVYKVSQRIVRLGPAQVKRDVQKWKYTPPDNCNHVKREGVKAS